MKKKLLDKVEDECLVLHFVSFYQYMYQWWIKGVGAANPSHPPPLKITPFWKECE